MKIATWNVNSLRIRLPHLTTWINAENPDVIALQEIKMLNEEFPYAELKALGYEAIASGQKSYNGVAILSRTKIEDPVFDLAGFADPQRRVLGVTIQGLRIFNLYVPNGQMVASEKYQYKLNWLESLHKYLQTELAAESKTILLGDFNIAPEEIDVHDPKRWAGKVLFSEPERAAFKQVLAGGFADCFRTLAESAEDYSWWDYRLQAYNRGWGLRIDHILASNSLIKQCANCYIDQKPRAWERPSDHAPVVAEFRL